MIDEAMISLDESSYHRRLAEAAPAGARLFKVDVQRATALAMPAEEEP